MAVTTGIAWTDATQNFWEGCTKVGPGCDLCYAEARDNRFHGRGAHWGPGAPRRRMVEATFRRPLVWNEKRRAYDAALRAGEPWPQAQPIPPQWVFTLSLGDFFDNAVDPHWREDAWRVIRDCRHLRWQIVTKRVGNVLKMLPHDWHMRDRDGEHYYRHVGILATVTDQTEYDRDVPKLAGLKSGGVRWVGLSVEPMLGPIRISPGDDPALDWVIIGGESSQGGTPARPFHLTWAEWLLRYCVLAGIPAFVKQLGSYPMTRQGNGGGQRLVLRDMAGSDPEQWPLHLRVQEMPTVYDGGLPRNRLAARP